MVTFTHANCAGFALWHDGASEELPAPQPLNEYTQGKDDDAVHFAGARFVRHEESVTEGPLLADISTGSQSIENRQLCWWFVEAPVVPLPWRGV